MRAQSRKNQLHGSEVATSSSIVSSPSFGGTDGVSDSTSVKGEVHGFWRIPMITPESESSNVPESRLSNEATEKNVKRKKIEPTAAQSRSRLCL